MKILSSKFYPRLAALACVAMASTVTAVHAASDDAGILLARAREYLGKDAALNAVKALRLLGTVTTAEGKARQIEIVVRRPLQQRVVEGNDDGRVITGLNDYDGWRRIERAGQGAGRVTLLDASDVRRLRASTWQYLYFYRDLEIVGGTVVIAGDAEIDSVPCTKAVFTHTGGITVERYLEKATGRLVMTKTDGGAETRENGVIEVDGVRFPKELTTTVNGKTSKLILDEIRVNEEFADALFETPRPQFNFDQKKPEAPAEPAATPGTAAP